MPTSQTIINKAFRLIGVLASGDSATAAENSDALDSLNSVIDGLSIDPNFYYTEQDEKFNIVAAQSNYCIGNASLSLSSLTVVTTIATATSITPHGLETGNKVTVSGATGADAAKLNITAAITVISATVFTYPIASATVDGGTAAVITAGDFYTTRPIRILGSFTRLSSVDSPIGIITEQYWTNVQDKNTTGATQTKLLYRQNFPFGQIIVYPIPTGTPVLHLKSEKCVSQFANLTTNYLLPPGYQRLLELGLAVELTSEYNSKISESVTANVKKSYEDIVAANLRQIQTSKLGQENANRA